MKVRIKPRERNAEEKEPRIAQPARHEDAEQQPGHLRPVVPACDALDESGYALKDPEACRAKLEGEDLTSRKAPGRLFKDPELQDIEEATRRGSAGDEHRKIDTARRRAPAALHKNGRQRLREAISKQHHK